MQKPVVVDLFCGAGGLSYGLQSAGLCVRAGVDIDDASSYPFKTNCKAEFLKRDVSALTGEELRQLFGSAEVKVLAGCAPCQPFSTYSNTRKTADDRWQLLRSFSKLALDVKPHIVTMENVVQLSQRPIWAEFVHSLERAGYHVSWDTFSCERFGVPQTRKRLVLLASRMGPVELPVLATGKTRTVRETIGHLPKIGRGAPNASDPLHVASRLSRENVERIRHSKPGGTWRDWPEHLRAKCHSKKTGETYPAVYGRMNWDEPAPTITTQFYGYGNGRFGHPEQDRAISIREAALLQSFPENYAFVSSPREVTFRRLGILIGNAVPPKLGEAIGQAILNHLS